MFQYPESISEKIILILLEYYKIYRLQEWLFESQIKILKNYSNNDYNHIRRFMLNYNFSSNSMGKCK